jgi:hypothetical protein
MMFAVSAMLTPAVCQNAQKRHSLGVKKRDGHATEHISRDKRVLAVVQFAERNFRIRAYESLLVYIVCASE